MPTAIPDTTRLVWFFGGGEAQGGRELVDLLGGKGANLHEMSRMAIPVPPGFTISTDACRYVLAAGGRWPEGLDRDLAENIGRIEMLSCRRFGDATNPLLLSVRSGAPRSMPGMMDTILNIGLTPETVKGLAQQMGEPRPAWDCYRRFVQMYGHVVAGIDGDRYEEPIEVRRRERGVETDRDLDADDWMALVETFRQIYAEKTGRPFPDDPMEQLISSIDAVFSSWNSRRAVRYREIHGFSHDGGTAVNVQAMVFGNLGEDSATGVAFTRDPATGEKAITGEWLPNTQGEDIVSGARTPHPLGRHDRERAGDGLETLEEAMPAIFAELASIFDRLERRYSEMQDVEFTVERGRLFILQTRTGKRAATAMVRIAHDLAREGLIDRREAVRRIDAGRVHELLHPTIAPAARKGRVPLAVGLGASPGSGSGQVVFDAETAAREAAAGRAVILVRRETVADDVGGMHAASGILTARGGATSHAAVVARGMGKPAVVGCTELSIDAVRRLASLDGRAIREGDWLTIDGASGEVFEGRLEEVPASLSREFARLMEWADAFRHLEVRANADTPADARQARSYGARGIGLCRTEHMFFDPRRIQRVREMMLLAPEAARLRDRREAGTSGPDDPGRLAEVETGYARALAALLPEQRMDFERLFELMEGLPVTIRLLDPPLHEFLPRQEAEREALGRALGLSPDEIATRITALTEANPMLGHRGCRLGITYPEIYEMQTRAILEAAVAVTALGVAVDPEIMIPLIATRQELSILRGRIERVAERVAAESGRTIPYRIGTMIELPRAALVADEIASEAEFFSFGTNDLTQTTWGISRDDAGDFLDEYRNSGIIANDPFAVLDRDGVGALMEIAIEKARRVRPDITLGLCGEHGGDPVSVAFCDAVGLDYVSCSPFRVPVARIAAAQAAIAREAIQR